MHSTANKMLVPPVLLHFSSSPLFLFLNNALSRHLSSHSPFALSKVRAFHSDLFKSKEKRRNKKCEYTEKRKHRVNMCFFTIFQLHFSSFIFPFFILNILDFFVVLRSFFVHLKYPSIFRSSFRQLSNTISREFFILNETTTYTHTRAHIG